MCHPSKKQLTFNPLINSGLNMLASCACAHSPSLEYENSQLSCWNSESLL